MRIGPSSFYSQSLCSLRVPHGERRVEPVRAPGRREPGMADRIDAARWAQMIGRLHERVPLAPLPQRGAAWSLEGVLQRRPLTMHRVAADAWADRCAEMPSVSDPRNWKFDNWLEKWRFKGPVQPEPLRLDRRTLQTGGPDMGA